MLQDLEELDRLVTELTCDKPQVEVLKLQMSRLGIEYCEDPAERMSRVLFLMQKIQFGHAQDLPGFHLPTIELNTQSKKIPAKDSNRKARKDGVEI